MPVRGGQLADVRGPVAHHPGEVAGVVQTPHDDAVQVHRLDEVAEKGALQAQHVPPAGRGGGQPGREGPPRVLPTRQAQQQLLCKVPALLLRCHCPHRAGNGAMAFGLVATTSSLSAGDRV